MTRPRNGKNGQRRGRRYLHDTVETAVEERIVYAETVDGFDLRGALIRPQGASEPADPLLIWIHTRQQSFADLEYVRIGRLLAGRGFHFLTVDTRGHDFGAWYRTPDGPRLQGSAWERFSDCVNDIDAWIEAARELGYRSVVLIGHGFGGAKSLHFQAQRQLPQVAAVVLASSGSSVRDKLPADLSDLAQRMVAEGRGLDLLPWGTGENYASSVSAEYYVARSILRKELYGTPDLPPAVARIRCPLIAWFGRLEDRPRRRVAQFLEWIDTNAVKSPHVDCALIDGIGFFYSGREEVVVQHLCAALERIGLVAKAPVPLA
ncbi:MAG: alpha/beta fold hydrolase [Azospirillaceae bacterium]